MHAIRNVLIVGVMLTTGSAEKAIPWVDYTSPDGRFSISLPCSPKEVTKKNGEHVVHTLTAFVNEVEGNNQEVKLATVVSYQELPKPVLTRKDAQGFLDGMQKGFCKSDDKLLSAQDITIEGGLGREVYAELSEAPGRVYRSRFYVMSYHTYSLLVVGGSFESVQSADANAFYDSFRIMKSDPELVDKDNNSEQFWLAIGVLVRDTGLIIGLVFGLYLLNKKYQQKKITEQPKS